jgi:hypothetical protein
MYSRLNEHLSELLCLLQEVRGVGTTRLSLDQKMAQKTTREGSVRILIDLNYFSL